MEFQKQKAGNDLYSSRRYSLARSPAPPRGVSSVDYIMVMLGHVIISHCVMLQPSNAGLRAMWTNLIAHDWLNL